MWQISRSLLAVFGFFHIGAAAFVKCNVTEWILSGQGGPFDTLNHMGTYIRALYNGNEKNTETQQTLMKNSGLLSFSTLL